MEMVHRVHFDPFGFDPETSEQLAGDRVAVAEQRIKMAGRIELEALAGERTAITADDIMLFDQQHLDARLSEKIGARQSGYPTPDDDGVVFRRRIFVDVQTSERAHVWSVSRMADYDRSSHGPRQILRWPA